LEDQVIITTIHYFFFGGGVKGCRFSNDLLSLNLKSNRWEKIDTYGDAPCPRYKHQSCIVSDKLFILGGGCYLPPEETMDVYVLCLQKLEWSRVKTTGEAPQGRAAHACEYDSVTNSIYIWGGFDSSLATLFDFYRLDLNTFHWSVQAHFTAHTIWPGRSFLSSCVFDGSLYSFSGSDGDRRFSDIMSFRLHCNPLKLIQLAAKSYRDVYQQTALNKLPQELVHQLTSTWVKELGYSAPCS